MKAVTINISLNPELAEFARSDSEAHAFDSMSEYMRDLIRNRRQQQIKRDVAYLEKAIEGAPLGAPKPRLSTVPSNRREGWLITYMSTCLPGRMDFSSDSL